MKITTKLKRSQLSKTIMSFPEQIRRTGESVLRQESRQFAKELARWTLPIGLSDRAWKKLAFKISGDIRRAIVSPRKLFNSLEKHDGRRFAKSVWALINGGGKKRVRTLAQMLAKSTSPLAKIIVSGNVRPELVKALRTGDYGNVPKKTEPNQIVTNEANIKKFITKMQRRTGFAKGGWSSAARMLSGRNIKGIPQWASYGRHKSPGSGIFTKSGKRIRLTNEVNYSRQALPPDCENRAKINAVRNFRLALTHAMNALTKKQFSRSSRRAA